MTKKEEENEKEEEEGKGGWVGGWLKDRRTKDEVLPGHGNRVRPSRLQRRFALLLERLL